MFASFVAITATFTMINPHADYQLPYQHFIRIMSPTVLIRNNACLQISFIPYTPCVVKLVYNLNNVYREIILHENIMSLAGDTARNLQLSLSPAMTNYTAFVIVLQTTTTINDRMLQLTSLLLSRTDCPGCKSVEHP